MLTSIGSSLGVSNLLSADSAAGLDAQIARDKKELSACVNCESAKTIEGKAKIEALSNKIGKTEARLAEIVAAQSTKPRVVEDARATVAEPQSEKVDNLTGSRIDIFA